MFLFLFPTPSPSFSLSVSPPSFLSKSNEKVSSSEDEKIKPGDGIGSLEKFLGHCFICVFMHQNYLVYFKKMQTPCPHPTKESESLRGEPQQSVLPDDTYMPQSLKEKRSTRHLLFCLQLSTSQTPWMVRALSRARLHQNISTWCLVMRFCILFIAEDTTLVNALWPSC